MIGTCQGCGTPNADVEPVRLGEGSVMLCEICRKEWELDK